MAKKTIYLSESQYSTIVGLDNSENSSLPPYTAKEITTGEGNENAEQLIGDKIAYSMATTGLGNRRSGLYCSKNSKKKIFEGGNKDFKDKTFKTTDDLHSAFIGAKTTYANYKDHKGYKTICNLINNRNVTASEMYRLKNRLENIDSNDIEYKMLCGDVLLPWINTTIGREQNMSQRHKKFESDILGKENAFIKKHTKNNGGRAKTTKNNNSNIINVSYEK
jgi:hypothetical protein